MENSMMHNTSFSRLPLCSHLLQQCLRSFCTETQWIYAVFWRILPRNFPPPKWEIGGFPDRTKANKRNWILVWEDGYCDFARAASGTIAGLQPDLFFKMSHEVYNYGEGLMGKVASDNGHKWVHKDLAKPEQAPSWQSSIDPQPRTWEGQFKSGIQTIAVISVCEGLVQLGSTQHMQEDLDFVAYLQRKFNNLLMTLPGSSSMAIALRESIDQTHVSPQRTLERQMSWNESNLERQMSWSNSTLANEAWEPSKSNHLGPRPPLMQGVRIGGDFNSTIIPSMNSLEALLSKLPSVTTFPNTQIHPPNQPLNIIKGYNGTTNVSLGHSSPPLLRTLSAPIGDYWLQEPIISSTNVTNPSMMVQPIDPQHQNLLQSQQNLGSNSFMIVDSNPSMGNDYPYLND